MHGLEIRYQCLERRPFGKNLERSAVGFGRLVADDDHRDMGMKRVQSGDCPRRFGDRIARVDDDDVGPRPRHGVQDRRGPAQRLDVESTPAM